MQPPTGDLDLVRILDANLAEAARRAGPHLACRIGCTQCCHGPFAINALDALRLRAGMEALRSSEPLRAKQVEQRAREWIDAYGPVFPGDSVTGVLGAAEEKGAPFEEFADDAACPALDPATGGCDLYAWRPMTCRIFGPPVRSMNECGEEGLGHCELCFTSATAEEVAACEMPVPHRIEERLLDEIGDIRETVVAFALARPSSFCS